MTQTKQEVLVGHGRLTARFAVLGLFFAVAGFLSVVVVPPAHAYPPSVNMCSDGSISWRFSNEFHTWPSNKQGWVRAAIGTLNDALDYDGSVLVTVTERSISSAVDVQLQNQPAQMYGSSECSGTPSTWLNSNYSAASFYYKTGRHEMFHIAGALHGGQNDSFDSVSPSTMSTCRDASTFITANTFEQDGHSYENYLFSSLGNRQLHSNIGFEQGTRFWGFSGGGAVTEYTSGGATGPGYVGWVSPNTTAYAFQTIRSISGNLSSVGYRAVANARTTGPTWTTSVRVALYRRTVNLPNQPGSPNPCSYPLGIVNPNGSVSTGAWVLSSQTPFTTVSQSWTPLTTSSVFPVAAEAYDWQVRLYGTAINGQGSSGQVRLDNLRGELTP